MSRRKTGAVKQRGFAQAPNNRPTRGLREEIAYRAARLIAEDGMIDFGAAKRKAARQLGITTPGLLPDNHELEAALRAQQAIFQSMSQPAECAALRKIAVDVMRWLHRYSPWLVGAVLSGSANHFSPIELEIVADDAKQLEMFFINAGKQFETRTMIVDQMQENAPRHSISIYEISFQEFPVVIALYPHHTMRVAHHPRDCLKRARAQLAGVEALLTG